MADLLIDRPVKRPARETDFPCIAFMQQFDIGKSLCSGGKYFEHTLRRIMAVGIDDHGRPFT